MLQALFQRSLDELDADVVGDAVAEATPWLARADARMLVRRAYGVLLEGLAERPARALVQALAARGVDVDRVDQDWLELPPVMACRRADLGGRTLVIYDPYGRSAELPWSRVLLVAAGSYVVAERKPMARKPFQPTPSTMRSLFGEADPAAGGYEYVDRAQIVLDIVADVPVRYRIQQQRFDYSYLGERRGASASSNFPLLVRDLLERVPHAILNPGARALRSDAAVASYPGPTQYEREIAWLLWRYLGPGTRLEGGDPYRSSGPAGPRLVTPLMRAARSAPAAPGRAPVAPAPASSARSPAAEPGGTAIPPGQAAALTDAGLALLGGMAAATIGWWVDPLAALVGLPVIQVVFRRLQRRRRQAAEAAPERDRER